MITAMITRDREFRSLLQTTLEQLEATKPLPLSVNGVGRGASDALLTEAVRAVYVEKSIPSLILHADEKTGREIAATLTANGVPAAFYPWRDPVFFNVVASHELERERLSVLLRLLRGGLAAVVTTPMAAAQYTMPANRLDVSSLHIGQGDMFSPEELVESLLAAGYTAVEPIDGEGQFAHRGGIVDIWSHGSEQPVRLEFFGDEIDRMCHFDPITQRSTGECDSFEMLPAREVIADGEARERILKAVRTRLKKAAGLPAEKALREELFCLEGSLELCFADKYMALVYPEQESLLSHFAGAAKRFPLFIMGTNETRENLLSSANLLRQSVSEMIESGAIHGSYACYSHTPEELEAFCAEQVTVHINSIGGGPAAGSRLAGLFGFRQRTVSSYAERLPMLLEDLGNFVRTKYRTLLVCTSAAEERQMAELLYEKHIPVRALGEDSPERGAEEVEAGIVTLTVGSVSGGYELLNSRIAVLSLCKEGAKTGRLRKRTGKFRRGTPAGKAILSYADLKEGDYVVHMHHGIGQYVGIKTMRIDGMTKDYISIRYAGDDELCLPAERLEVISKYIGAHADDGQLKLSRLGGTEWAKQKSRATAAAKDMARELIQLYAERQRRAGYAFPADGELEKEFEDSFEFEETECQLKAVEEIKNDMRRPVPMDRLLCGDVGYGKTEVALRAVFKAVCAGKQAAILVPTTILCMQHYQTALSRMRGYAVNIEMLSRFRTAKEQASILRRLKRGEIDLIIGTHKLFGRGVEFRDLGLLVVDEEQRFGVTQKERIKMMAKDVDVLTLTATPIPRTLNMAMNGIRDLSILDEAPSDRYPVQTFVMEHDEAIITEALRRELSRNGQVLYLYNNIDNIDLVAARVSKALPEARVAYAHGQMEREEIEDIWQQMVQGEIDILICTTIVETGVDLPNANTLIIEGADRMGLSQLHQIRGRVGRSGRHAYAYFTYRRGKALSEIAEKRLAAIRDYASFGAGFKIALRDLEIRGAGNLLGAEQHGHIDSVGYDLYVRLLNEAVLEEQGKKAAPAFEATVDIRADAHIPESYIGSSSARMEMYKKISLILTFEDMSDVLDEFFDRFGEPPKAVIRLVNAALCRSLASRCRVERVAQQENNILFFMPHPDLSLWSEVFTRHRGMRFRSDSARTIYYRLQGGEDAFEAAIEILGDYLKAESENADESDEKSDRKPCDGKPYDGEKKP